MSFFIDESDPVETFCWDTKAKFIKNLGHVDYLSFALTLRDQCVGDQEKDIVELAKEFSKSLSDLVDTYGIKFNKLCAEKLVNKPMFLTKQDFLDKMVDLFKANKETYQEFLEDLGFLEETKAGQLELKTEAGLVEYIKQISAACSMRLNVRFNFENFFAHRIIENKHGAFLLCSAYGDWECEVFFFVYFTAGSDELQTYVPKQGNHWDIEKMRAYEHDGTPISQDSYNIEQMCDELVVFFDKNCEVKV